MFIKVFFVTLDIINLNLNKMKNLLLVLALNASNIIFSQTSKLEGSWSSYDNTSYVTTISVSKFTGSIDRVYSYSSYEEKSKTEKIIKQYYGTLETSHCFEDYQCSIKSKYVSLNDTLMKRIITGSVNTVLLYKKINK